MADNLGTGGTDGCSKSGYTCQDRRQEMILLGLRNRLQQTDLSPEDRDKILQEIHALQRQMGLD